MVRLRRSAGKRECGILARPDVLGRQRRSAGQGEGQVPLDVGGGEQRRAGRLQSATTELRHAKGAWNLPEARPSRRTAGERREKLPPAKQRRGAVVRGQYGIGSKPPVQNRFADLHASLTEYLAAGVLPSLPAKRT